jgi:hypothetical protein
MHGGLIIWLALIAVAGCSGGGGTSTTSTTTTLRSTTTSAIPNPFLDVVEGPSNFSAGDVVDVVGVSLDNQAWVGSFPADDVAFFGGLWEVDRLNAELIATGEAASYLGGPVWEKVGREGREPGYFLQENTGVIGRTDDVTNQAADLVGESVDGLITTAAESFGVADGLQPIQITQRGFGGRGVFYDLIGGADPLSRGYRLRIVVAEQGATFVPLLLERSIICVHSVNESGDCA